MNKIIGLLLLFVWIVGISITVYHVAYVEGIKEGIKRQVGDEPYQIVTDNLLAFDLWSIRCPRCNSKEMVREWHGDKEFYAIGCKKCGLEGKIVQRNFCVLNGEVIEVATVWTKNGDGGLTILLDGGQTTDVSIVGWPDSKATKIELKSVKYVSDLVGKKIEVIGNSKDNNHVVAKSIKEI